jgi:hypothetical protein
MGKLMTVVCSLPLIALIVLGLFLFLKGARNIQMALASTGWPKASGVVIRSEMERDVSPGTRRSAGSVTFNTDTVIQYTVSGQKYTTNTLHFGQTLGSGDKSVAELQRFRYPPGREVTVSYNPANPSMGVMKPGLHAEAFWLVGAGLAFLLPAILCLFIVTTTLRDVTRPSNDDAFANSVRHAIDAAKRGERLPDVPPPPPGGSGDDTIMAVVAAFLGAVFCGLGVLALNVGLQRVWHGMASEGWPTTPGVVIFNAAGLGETEEAANDDTADFTSYARIVYRYEVAGTTHFNNVRRFAQIEGGGGEEANRVASSYAKGANVKVSYFPTDPDIAVLEPGNTKDSLILPGVGLACILFSLAVFFIIVPSVARPMPPIH